LLSLLFFISVFTSLVWLVYSGLFVSGRFQTIDISSVDAHTLALYVGLVLIPVWIVWQVFGFISQYFKTKSTDTKLLQLFSQMKKNQDYTDLVVRVMIDAEHEIKDGFIVGKFDIFVADINEILADIVRRSNAASTMKLEELWLKVKNGERWSIAKTFIENAKATPDFDQYLKEKANKDSVFKGTLLEFCARYQNLMGLLEKHDRDRVFITILETGVMGKVYSILAPVALGVRAVQENDASEDSLYSNEQPFEDLPQIALMDAPKEEKTESFFKRLNPFSKRGKKQSDTSENQNVQDDDEAFFSALQKSMSEDAVAPEPQNLNEEPRFEINFEQKALPEENVKEEQKQPTALETEDNLAYPFGGWTDDAQDTN